MDMLNSEKGQALIETVLILPVILIIIGSVIGISIGYTEKMLVDYSAFAGARSAVVNLEDPSSSATHTVEVIFRGIRDFFLGIPLVSSSRLETDVKEEEGTMEVHVSFTSGFSAPFIKTGMNFMKLVTGDWYSAKETKFKLTSEKPEEVYDVFFGLFSWL